MKNAALALLLQGVVLLGASHAQLVTNTNNIKFWVGSGTNWSVLVLDFRDGAQKQAFAWGYRYNSPAPSGARMLVAIDAADSNLNLTYSGTADSDLFLKKVEYFDGTTQHSQTIGDFVSDDRYWAYQVAGGFVFDALLGEEIDLNVTGPFGGPTAPQTWLEAPCGASDISFGDRGRFLSAGAWDIWVFGSYGQTPGNQIFAATPPTIPKPEASIRFATNQAVITVPSQAGFNYRLTYSGQPEGPWTNGSSIAAGVAGGTNSFTNSFPPGTGSRFFRVVISQ